MRIIEGFKDKTLISREVENIFTKAKKLESSIKIMEVCGTHTMQIAKYGLRKLLPSNISLISGPGCPVCVSETSLVDKAIFLLKKSNIGIICFGDLFRVKGSSGSLEFCKAEGADVRIVYSPMEIIDISKDNYGKNFVFLSIGFETTMPSVASVIKHVYENKIKNVFFIVANKYFIVALKELIRIGLEKNNIFVNGFILPGHLSTIVGVKPYEEIFKNHKLSGVIAGFEPLDILRSVELIVSNILNSKFSVINEYTRAVAYNGNILAQKIIKEVFTTKDDNWRGLGLIKKSGAVLKDKYKHLDAEVVFSIPKFNEKQNLNCRCSEVLLGKISPNECNFFEKICTPQNPLGPCMVSSEGSCASYYKYERL